MTTETLNLADLKAQTPKNLLAMAEELEIENASTMRKGEMMFQICLLYTSPSPRDRTRSRMPSSA